MGTEATRALVGLRWTQRVATVFSFSAQRREKSACREKQGVIFLWGFADSFWFPDHFPRLKEGYKAHLILWEPLLVFCKSLGQMGISKRK